MTFQPWGFSRAVAIGSEADLRAWERSFQTRVQRFLCDRGIHRWHRHAAWPPMVPPLEIITTEQAARWREVRGG